MCKKLLVVLLVLCVAGIATAAAPTDWTEVGYWSFDNSANLAANAYGVAGYAVGSPGSAPGYSGLAMDCAGTGGVAIPQQVWTPNIKSKKIMYDFWIYGKSALGFGDVENIAFQWEATGQGSYLASLGDIHGAIDGFCWLNGDNNYQLIQGWPCENYPNPTDLNWTDTLVDSWAHIQMVYAYNRFSIYVNDQLFHSGNNFMAGGPSAGIAGTVTYGQIGGRTYPGGSQSIQGLIDEFKIFTPEPTTIALLGLGGLFLRKRKTA